LTDVDAKIIVDSTSQSDHLERDGFTWRARLREVRSASTGIEMHNLRLFGSLRIRHVDLDLRQLFALNVLLQMIDGMLTYTGMRVGMTEGNPLLSASMAAVGAEPALLLYKAGACGLLLLVSRWMRPNVGGPALLGVAMATTLLALVPWLGKLLALIAV
jgi:hypothetical protein